MPRLQSDSDGRGPCVAHARTEPAQSFARPRPSPQELSGRERDDGQPRERASTRARFAEAAVGLDSDSEDDDEQPLIARVRTDPVFRVSGHKRPRGGQEQAQVQRPEAAASDEESDSEGDGCAAFCHTKTEDPGLASASLLRVKNTFLTVETDEEWTSAPRRAKSAPPRLCGPSPDRQQASRLQRSPGCPPPQPPPPAARPSTPPPRARGIGPPRGAVPVPLPRLAAPRLAEPAVRRPSGSLTAPQSSRRTRAGPRDLGGFGPRVRDQHHQPQQAARPPPHPSLRAGRPQSQQTSLRPPPQQQQQPQPQPRQPSQQAAPAAWAPLQTVSVHPFPPASWLVLRGP